MRDRNRSDQSHCLCVVLLRIVAYRVIQCEILNHWHAIKAFIFITCNTMTTTKSTVNILTVDYSPNRMRWMAAVLFIDRNCLHLNSTSICVRNILILFWSAYLYRNQHEHSAVGGSKSSSTNCPLVIRKIRNIPFHHANTVIIMWRIFPNHRHQHASIINHYTNIPSMHTNMHTFAIQRPHRPSTSWRGCVSSCCDA